MKPRVRFTLAGVGLVCVLSAALSTGAAGPTRDTEYFLHRLRTLEHLPELENSHTAMASTWDRTGRNADGTDYRRIEGTTNVLFDANGPGCIHRLFTGGATASDTNTPGYLKVDGTRVQIYLDRHPVPVFDYPVIDFFDPAAGPVPAPLAGRHADGWTYPGCLMPIPYAHHCRVQLVNPEKKNWGCYWQVTYSTYPSGTPVRTLSWPPSSELSSELARVCETWLRAQSQSPAPPHEWTDSRAGALAPGASAAIHLRGAGLVRELRVALDPPTPELLRGVKLSLTWDGEPGPAVDVPIGAFFGHTHSGHAGSARYSTLLMGVTAHEAYSRFPMPYSKGAVIALLNENKSPVRSFHLKVDAEKRRLPHDWGRFRATWNRTRVAAPGAPVFGAKDVPGHIAIERQGRGKYVGMMLSVDWPHEGWWGEGDWLIWTDETGWPPSYHGTGSEEYFNSGWCKFDRKAVSGYVAVHPGYPTQYSFHLNDAFPFRESLRVAVEAMGWDKADGQIRQEHPAWETVAYWYSASAR